MKSMLLSSLLAATFALAPTIPTASVAEAKTNVDVGIFFGVPHYSHRLGPDYRFRRGYGWYLPRHERYRMSCGEAKWSVRNRGYRNVATIECRGATYTFRATRNGNRVKVYVNARTGAVWRA